jgi:hypothetical protein
MITGRAPWKVLNIKQPWALFHFIVETPTSPLDEELKHGVDVPAALQGMLQLCFRRNFRDRPYAHTLAQEPWFHEVDDRGLSMERNESTIQGLENELTAKLRLETLQAATAADPAPKPPPPPQQPARHEGSTTRWARAVCV